MVCYDCYSSELRIAHVCETCSLSEGALQVPLYDSGGGGKHLVSRRVPAGNVLAGGGFRGV
jgi:hypothetical protein